MIIVEKTAFKKASKKLKPNQQKDLQQGIKKIAEDIYNGRLKKGDLKGVRVHKFKMIGQLMLLAYKYEQDILTLTLIKLGSHENFYRDLKR